MVVVTLNHLSALVLTLGLLTRDFGAFMLICLVWWPIASTIKLELEVAIPIRKAMRDHQTHIEIEGSIVSVTPMNESSGELSVGMSMGEP